MKRITPLFLIFVLAIGGCANKPYTNRLSRGDLALDAAARYGTIAAAGGAGYYIGDQLGGGAVGGGMGAVAGLALGYGLMKFSDGQRDEAYAFGVEDGAALARAEHLNEKWRREAIYGMPPDGQGGGGNPTYRQVYVPSRTINNVKMQGTYQTVPVYR
jgi:hypothetical protein